MMKNPRLLRTISVFIVLLMPLCFFIYFELNKPKPPRPLPRYGKVPYFRLIDQEGDTITSDDLKGYFYVSDFFFTHCPGICPKMTKIQARIQAAYKAEPRVKLVSVTVDPDRDSINVLKAYADKYGADPFKWFFLTGPKKDIYTLIKDGFKLPVVEDSTTQFDHSDRLVLVDGDGKIRGYYAAATDSTQIDSLFNGIEGLLVEKPQ